MKPHPDPLPRVESPCINVCTLDTQGVCVGCGRSIDEIAGWGRMSPDEQRHTCERAAERREQRRNRPDRTGTRTGTRS